MPNYNFSTLNDKELEELSRDLLSRELSIPFQSFKGGKDKGIDLRFSTSTSENQVIVQVKHYLLSGLKQLLYVLKNDEKIKIEKLAPSRYILVTSIGLSPYDKEKIKAILSPYILSTNDIYACDDLNRLLVSYPDIERKYFKLWFSNVNIIQKIINNGVDGRSAFIEEKIRKNIGVYVVNKSFDKALEILREQKVLLIIGIPGIGKTSLANLITYNLLSKDFKLVYIDDRIKDAEDVFENDTSCKQLFYFDDFLGSNYLDIIKPKNTENTIVDFIDRVRSTKNKYLLLTTRSTILNQARTANEKLSRANLESLKYELEISKYSVYDKAKILYNHLFFNDLDIDMIHEIFINKNYWKIIKHDNYNPRLIEYFTKEQNVSHLNHTEYYDFIISNLDNPEKIWSSALDNQLNQSERFLLFSLLTLNRFVSKSILEYAYEARIEFEVFKGGFTRIINQFNNSFRNLLGGYILNTASPETRNNYVDFVNPSLRDYLISYFNENEYEKLRLIDSLIYIEQFLSVFKIEKQAKNNIIIKDNEVRKFLEAACTSRIVSTDCKDVSNISIRKIKLLFDFRSESTKNYVDRLILNCFDDIAWESFSILYIDDLMPLLINVEKESQLFEYLKSKAEILIDKITDRVYYVKEIELLTIIYNRFEIDYNAFLEGDDNWRNKKITAVSRVFKFEADLIIGNKLGQICSPDDFADMEEAISDKFDYLRVNFLNDLEIDQPYNPCDDIDQEALIEENRSSDVDDDGGDWRFSSESYSESQGKVDDLFSGFER